MSDQEYSPPLVHLPGTKLTPEVVLHRTINKLPRIRAVLVVIQWDDESYDLDWSSMKSCELAMASVIMSAEASDIITGKKPAT